MWCDFGCGARKHSWQLLVQVTWLLPAPYVEVFASIAGQHILFLLLSFFLFCALPHCSFWFSLVQINKFWIRIFFSPKKLWHKFFLGQRKCGSEIFLTQQIWVGILFSSKKNWVGYFLLIHIWVGNFFDTIKFGSEICLIQKVWVGIFFLPKKFGLDIFFYPKICWSEIHKILTIRTTWGFKKMGPKLPFLGAKNWLA